MQKLTEHQWAVIRQEWETSDVTYRELAHRHGLAQGTIQNRKREEQWTKQADDTPGGEALAALDAPMMKGSGDMIREGYAVGEAVRPAKDFTPLPDSELQARIDALEAENAKLREKVESLKGTAKISLYATPDEVRSVLGDEHLRSIAEQQLAIENQQRYRQGLPPLDLAKDPGFEDRIQRIIAGLLKDRTSHVSPAEHLLRVMKMVKPDGTIIQVPIENQVSNMAGEQLAPLAKAKVKGYRVADPYLCQMYNCWMPAARDGGTQAFAYHGYCSPDHAQFDPDIKGVKVEGVTTTASRMMAGSLT